MGGEMGTTNLQYPGAPGGIEFDPITDHEFMLYPNMVTGYVRWKDIKKFRFRVTSRIGAEGWQVSL